MSSLSSSVLLRQLWLVVYSTNKKPTDAVKMEQLGQHCLPKLKEINKYILSKGTKTAIEFLLKGVYLHFTKVKLSLVLRENT